MAKQITEEQIEKIVEGLIDRVNKANTIFLKEIGSSILKIKDVKPSKAHQLQQILKYGMKYDDILDEIQRQTNMNINEIDEIFNAYAKKDLDFYKQFYQYRNKPFIPYNKNRLLKQQTMALANVVRNEMYNYTRDNVLGYTINGKFYNMRETYNQLLDEAFLQVGQGKETFDTAMRGILKGIGGSGIRTLDYESGRSIRLDSAVRMHLKGRLRELHNENQKIVGKEFGADGVEISVHYNPAPDHELVQGRQFSMKEYENLQSGLMAKDYKGNSYTLDHDGKNGYRPISEMNCYHYVFDIILGVSRPEYDDEELQKIRDANDKGFEYEGQHYSMYEGTQLQRKLEREIRKQKDIQIIAKASGNNDLLLEAESNINMLSTKYKELCSASGLRSKRERLSVSGYKKTHPRVLERIEKSMGGGLLDSNRPSTSQSVKNLGFEEWKDVFDKKNVKIKDSVKLMDKDLLDRNLNYLDSLTNRYDVTKNQYLEIGYASNTRYIGVTYYGHNEIEFSKKYFKDKAYLIEVETNCQNGKWHSPVKLENYDIETLAHEYGHAIEDDYTRRYIKKFKGIDTSQRRLRYSRVEDNLRKEIDKNIRDEVFDKIRSKEKLSITEIKEKYFSGYAKSKRHYEWFAEAFAQLELGEPTVLTEALKEWMDENL